MEPLDAPRYIDGEDGLQLCRTCGCCRRGGREPEGSYGDVGLMYGGGGSGLGSGTHGLHSRTSRPPPSDGGICGLLGLGALSSSSRDRSMIGM